MLNSIHHASQPEQEDLKIDRGIIDSKRLQMFYHAAKEGTFATTAQLLGVGPSAVSHAIKSLEEDLGFALFKRSGPHVSPTWLAMRLLPLVGDLLSRMAMIKAEVEAMAGRGERLDVAVAPEVRGMIRPSVMSEFRECFPGASVEIRPYGTQVESREFDFTMGYAHDVPEDSVHRILAREEIGIYAAPFHGLGQGGRVTRADLRKSTLVFPDRGACGLITGALFDGAEGGLKTWIMPDAESARNMALQGQCMAFLPEWALGDCLEDGSLNQIKMPGMVFQRGFCAWWQPGRPLAWISEVFLDLLAADLDGAGSRLPAGSGR
jgi:DNA-binding transcriptional LysR family regulator